MTRRVDIPFLIWRQACGDRLASFPGRLLLHFLDHIYGGSKVTYSVKKTEQETAWEQG